MNSVEEVGPQGLAEHRDMGVVADPEGFPEEEAPLEKRFPSRAHGTNTGTESQKCNREDVRTC